MKISANLNIDAAIQVNSNGQFVVYGALSFDTVPILFQRGCQLISASPRPIFDLKHVTASDNAGLALLLAWIKCAKKFNKQIFFLNIPAKFWSILEVGNLKKFIPVGARA